MLKFHTVFVGALVVAALAVSVALPRLPKQLTAVPQLTHVATTQETVGGVTSNSAIPDEAAEQRTAATATGDRAQDTDSTAPVSYDPLAILYPQDLAPLDLEFTDEARKRKLPLRVYLPAKSTDQAPTPQPVVLFSHGLGGSRQGSTFLGQHWAKRGYIAVFLQHPGSDEEVWRNTRLNQRRNALVQAANGQQLNARKSDVVSVLDQLEKWNQQPTHPLVGRMDLTRVGLSGHSFGARTTKRSAAKTRGAVPNRLTNACEQRSL